MADDPKRAAKRDGIHAGDWVVRALPALGTDGHLDTPEGRERERSQEADARAAQYPGAASEARAEPAAIPFGGGGDLDDSIEQAREALAPQVEGVPILLRDPLTGKVIGEG